jgi:hypothetical protein
MEEIAAAESDSEEDNNRYSTSSCRCPFCGTSYRSHQRCDHLLGEELYVESNSAFDVAPNCPAVVKLFGEDVPRVVALRFFRFLRDQYNPPSYRGTIVDLLNTTHSVAAIKRSMETPSYFREWTWYLSRQPEQDMLLFEQFVDQAYRDVEFNSVPVLFSQMHIDDHIILLGSQEALLNGTEAPARWMALTGFPDHLPLFLFPVESRSGLVYAGTSENLLQRMKCWESSPSAMSMFPLKSLPSIAVN